MHLRLQNLPIKRFLEATGLWDARRNCRTGYERQERTEAKTR